MWNRDHSEDYGCMGVVIQHYFEKQDHDELITEFVVLWADNDRCESMIMTIFGKNISKWSNFDRFRFDK